MINNIYNSNIDLRSAWVNPMVHELKINAYELLVPASDRAQLNIVFDQFICPGSSS
jgi:hypothetical protein